MGNTILLAFPKDRSCCSLEHREDRDKRGNKTSELTYQEGVQVRGDGSLDQLVVAMEVVKRKQTYYISKAKMLGLVDEQDTRGEV